MSNSRYCLASFVHFCQIVCRTCVQILDTLARRKKERSVMTMMMGLSSNSADYKGKSKATAGDSSGLGASGASSAAALSAAQLAKQLQQQENLPWVEKYRPKQLDDLISHQDIISTIHRFINENKLPHLLFYGPPGTGKTSTILACAKKLYGEKSSKSMVLELNASDERGIEVVREQIKNFASSKTMFSNGGYKLIILDEADAMTQFAQNALRRVIEKYTKNVRFCIICNYVVKIIPALQSRCTRFRFAPLQNDQIETRLDWIVDQER